MGTGRFPRGFLWDIVGELGMVGRPAAIANAVFYATDKRIREPPITPHSCRKGNTVTPARSTAPDACVVEP